jgi:beta-galactosidase beta subunit
MLHGNGHKFVIVTGQFWIAFPSDGHWPALQTDHPDQILKGIVKIKSNSQRLENANAP